MFGNEDSPQEVLLKNHVEYGGEASELWEFRWANGELVFPPAEHAHANARRQANLKSRSRGTKWRVPEITQELFILFEANDVMLSLFQNSKSKKSNPVPPKMSTKTRSGRASNGEDDESAEYSFNNETAHQSTATFAPKKTKLSKKGEFSVDGLTDALANCDIGKKAKRELLQAINDFLANGDCQGLQKFVLESGHVYTTSVKYVQLTIGAHQPLIPNMSVTESMRQSDSGTLTRRSLVLKIHILHPNDAKLVSVICMLRVCDVFQSIFTHLAVVNSSFQYSLSLNDKLATEDGYCVLEFTFPVISKADLNALEMLSKSMNMEIEDYYGGLADLDKACLTTNNNIRKMKMENALALCHKDQDVSKPVTLETLFCKLPVLKGEQTRTITSEWQGEKHDKKAQLGAVKLEMNFSVGDVEDEEGEVHPEQVMWYLTAEIPLEGGEEKTLKSPGAKKLKSQKDKMAKLKGGLVADDSTTAATSSGTNAVGAVANPTEEKEDEADEEKEDVDEDNVESVEDKADEVGGVIDSTAGEEEILNEEEGGEAEATEGGDEDHQEYLDGLINEAKGSLPADFLNLNVNTDFVGKAVTAVSSIASPKFRQAASYIMQSPTIQGMLPFTGKSIEAEPYKERGSRNTRNLKPTYRA
eukprot:scaffold3829_cov85-Skeletonema_menzelii.AAC.2